MSEPKSERERMVERHLRARGIRDELVLEAFRTVPREDFVPADLVEFAYADTALPIGEKQTISQPYVVALTVAALRLSGGERVLEVGTGSGYAAAILGRIAGEVVTIERIESLASEAKARLTRLGFTNVDVLVGDGTRGCADRAPYDAIAVSAGATEVPIALRSQLAIGGRLVIPVGAEESLQVLVRITRLGVDEYVEEPLEDVRFVPLVSGRTLLEDMPVRPIARSCRAHPLAILVREVAEPLTDIGGIDALIERIGDSRVVLLGEATHGTSEFYRMRAQITKELILRHGFSFVAMEADWPDAARIDDYVRGTEPRSFRWSPFSRFPTWLWRNQEFAELVEWLRSYNAATPLASSKVGVHGL
ncbi:MAG: protein-L-isoaspartate(D-aspartate) O-methyltransferase, partial [Polyangiaceae bacterium]